MKKTLPFTLPLEINDSPLSFNSKKVVSFSPKKYAKIVYYKSEDDFAINLSFKDEENEMILVKTKLNEEKSLKDYLPNVEEYKLCSLYPDDILEIPEIEFDLESKFPTLKDTKIQQQNDGREALIKEISQRTSFVLDHKGASRESETIMIGQSWNCMFPEKKVMKFDKPFAVYLKKKKNIEPYFATLFSTAEFFKPSSK